MDTGDTFEDEDHNLQSLLQELQEGDRPIDHRMISQLYEELRELAHKKLRYQRRNHTLNTTALVHEAYLKLSSQEDKVWNDRGHFMATAAQVMRHVLINYAEKRNTLKRGGDRIKMSLDTLPEVIDEQQAELLLGLNEALDRLAQFDERGARIVELQFFGGFSQVEIAEMLGVTDRTVRRSWLLAKTWIQKELKREDVLP